MEETFSLLKKCDLFADFGDAQLQVIAGLCKEVPYPAGSVIFGEAVSDDKMYIVKQGTVLITKATDEGAGRDVARFRTGESFGELNVFQAGTTAASAVAEGDTVLLTFPGSSGDLDAAIGRNPEVYGPLLFKILGMVSRRIRQANELLSEKSQWIEDLKRQMLMDKLTGLWNRTYLDDEFSRALPGYGERTALLFLKPDNFKEINDNFGHDAGDEALRVIAETIKTRAHEKYIPARYRGDENVIILPDSGIEEAVQAAYRVRDDINAMDVSSIAKDGSLVVKVSVGVALYPDHADTGAKLMEVARALMMEARNNGGNEVARGK